MFAPYFVFFLFSCQTCILCSPVTEVDDLDCMDVDYDAFRTPNEETGRKVETWSKDSGMHAEEMGNYFEGDIMLPPKSSSRNGLRDENYRWKNATIPFVIEGKFPDDVMNTIKKAFETYHNKTCIRFVPKKDTDKDYIAITSDYTGCWSYAGRIGGRQGVNLQTPGCTTEFGTILHELMHAAGFHHEHNRPERDDFVTIHFENIDMSLRYNFDKLTDEMVTSFGQPYDYFSTMHYSQYAFSNNGKPTIVPKDPEIREPLGQRDGFGKYDVNKLNAMYKCQDVPSDPAPVTEPEAEATTESGGDPIKDLVSSFLGIFNIKI